MFGEWMQHKSSRAAFYTFGAFAPVICSSGTLKRGGLSIIFIIRVIKGGGSNDSSIMPLIWKLIHNVQNFF
jgi:hypothetical protein